MASCAAIHHLAINPSSIAELHSTAAIQSPYTWQRGKSNRLAFKVTIKGNDVPSFFPQIEVVKEKIYSFKEISFLKNQFVMYF